MKTSKAGEFFRNSNWGPKAVKAMCDEVRDFTVPGGKDGKVLTMGDLIDRTPKDAISKVMLEEKVFDTWSGGRAVLLGDGRFLLFRWFCYVWTFSVLCRNTYHTLRGTH